MTSPATPPPQQKWHKLHTSHKEREFFTENLGLLLKSAVPVSDALTTLSTTARTSAMRKTLDHIRLDVDAGYSLAQSVERSGLVSSQTLALIQLGEESGRLVENLQIAAEQEAKQHVFRSKIRSALLYPSFVLGITLIVGLGVGWFLLPRLSETFNQLHVALPPISQFMINIGLFLKAYGAIVVPLMIIVGAVIGYILFGAPKTKSIGRRLLFKLPGIGRLLSEIEVSQFGYLLGTLLNAGLPITEAVILLAGASPSPQYKKFYRYLAESLGDGFSMKDSLHSYKKSAKLIPPSVQQIVIAGEQSGSLSDVLLVVGRTYEQKADVTTNNLEVIIEPVLLLFVSAGVLVVGIAVLLPIYSLLGGLNK